ncbi:hypothetical protein [Streptomyces sp. NBC_01483]|uniref:hypothetical protein n=1 Tax=Streptomyces sp. NBC_01483 TaxID=2903883 RepID=UPI002E3014B1|nr:hypothetical protein [Streptomyces sp. NBC_01483]
MLIDAQNELAQLRCGLRVLFEKVPWSVEPMDAWETHENAWRPASRPASPGWDPEDAAEIARLRARELELAESPPESPSTHIVPLALPATGA